MIYIITVFLTLIDDYDDRERFKKLYGKYRGLMAKVASEKVYSKEDIEDVLQDAFFYIARNFSKIGEVDSQRTKNYLCVITESFAISKFRKEKKYLNTASFDETADIEPAEIDFNLYDAAELEIALESLSDEYRNLMYLTYVFGYSSKEIAALYHITDSNIRKKIQFAKERLKNLLEGNYNG